MCRQGQGQNSQLHAFSKVGLKAKPRSTVKAMPKTFKNSEAKIDCQLKAKPRTLKASKGRLV